MNFRQVHLDFHTSEKIPSVGEAFDAIEFATTLKGAHVNSITCFARCHHGWLYYDSKRFPELIHPQLKNKNLLREQVEACHEKGIKVPIYITVQWDHKVAREHSDWLVRDTSGAPVATKTFEAGFYQNICLNSPYRDYLKAITKDVLESFEEVDGLFFDILNLRPCACHRCVEDMVSLDMDPTKDDVRYAFAQSVMDDFKSDMSLFVRGIRENLTIFYNAGYIGTRHKKAIDTFSHLEIESLPSGFWGYMHFPVTAFYARNLGLDFLGMTGKFHTEWGDFSSFKTPAALEYECFRALSFTGKCSIGDQLHPSGSISKEVYDLIGSVYSQVEVKEPWCIRAKPVVEVGIFASEEFLPPGNIFASSELIGVVRMMMELGIQCDVMDSTFDFNKYQVIIMPDYIPVDHQLEKKLTAYVERGGAILASYHSGLKPNQDNYISLFPIEKIGEAPYSPDFLVVDGDMSKKLYRTEYVMYQKGMEVKKKDGAKELLKVNIPYFNRSWKHFCSHRHTPSSGEYGYPGVVKKGKVIYFVHPIFSQYNDNGARWVKQLVSNAIDRLIDNRLVEHNGPSSLEVTLNIQKTEKRYVLHLLHYIPERRTQTIDIIEDVIPLYNIDMTLHLPVKIKHVKRVPSMETLSFNQENDKITIKVPRIEGHEMVEFKYE